MTEEFVTLETAKLLKEKGFKENVFTFYEAECAEGDFELFESYEVEDFNARADNFSAPTQSIAQKWLRENHSIHIAVDFNQYGRWYYRLYDIKDYDFLSETEVDKIYKSYEEALEAGIQEALKLI